MEYVLGSKEFKVWINPEIGDSEPEATKTESNASEGTYGVQGLRLFQYASDVSSNQTGKMTIDAMRMATAWADLFPKQQEVTETHYYLVGDGITWDVNAAVEIPADGYKFAASDGMDFQISTNKPETTNDWDYWKQGLLQVGDGAKVLAPGTYNLTANNNADNTYLAYGDWTLKVDDKSKSLTLTLDQAKPLFYYRGTVKGVEKWNDPIPFAWTGKVSDNGEFEYVLELPDGVNAGDQFKIAYNDAAYSYAYSHNTEATVIRHYADESHSYIYKENTDNSKFDRGTDNKVRLLFYLTYDFKSDQSRGAHLLPLEIVAVAEPASEIDNENGSVTLKAAEGLTIYYLIDYDDYSQAGESEEEVKAPAKAQQLYDLSLWTKAPNKNEVTIPASEFTAGKTLNYLTANEANEQSAVKAISKDINGTITGINDIAVDGEGTEAVFYNLQGVKVAKPAAGNVYIKVAGGKASKVMVK